MARLEFYDSDKFRFRGQVYDGKYELLRSDGGICSCCVYGAGRFCFGDIEDGTYEIMRSLTDQDQIPAGRRTRRRNYEEAYR